MSQPNGAPPLNARTRALQGLAADLRLDAERFQNQASEITEGMMRGADGDRAYGADSRNVPAVQAITAYTDVSDDTRRFLTDVGSGLLGISRSVSAIAGALGDQDDENAARIRRILNLDDDA